MHANPVSEGSGHQEALLEICSRTAHEAFRRKPHADIPPAIHFAGPLDYGAGLNTPCSCQSHAVRDEVFAALNNDHQKRVLQHWASCWLVETCEYIRQMQQNVRGKSRPPWPDTVDVVVQDFFSFNFSRTPEIFQRWLGTALHAEVTVVGDFVDRGIVAVAGEIEKWNQVAAALANVFKRQLDTVLKDLAQPRPMKPPQAQRESNRLNYWGEERKAMRTALLNPQCGSDDFEYVIRFIDTKKLYRDKDGHPRLLEAECHDKPRKKILMNYLRLTKIAMEEMGEYTPQKWVSALP